MMTTKRPMPTIPPEQPVGNAAPSGKSGTTAASVHHPHD
jgi:hypothetical protein